MGTSRILIYPYINCYLIFKIIKIIRPRFELRYKLSFNGLKTFSNVIRVYVPRFQQSLQISLRKPFQLRVKGLSKLFYSLCHREYPKNK